jgi:serine/threonine protein phosphatase PrpC
MEDTHFEACITGNVQSGETIEQLVVGVCDGHSGKTASTVSGSILQKVANVPDFLCAEESIWTGVMVQLDEKLREACVRNGESTN